MVVKAQYRGNRVSGLYVGSNNVRRYFSKRFRVVELQLDNVRILCGLTPHFWQDEPEIHDPRLCVWLEAKHPPEAPCQAEIPLAMIPSGKNSFMLTSIAPRTNGRDRQMGVTAAQIRAAWL